MVTVNIDGKYSVTGTNDCVVTCLSTDTKPIGPRSYDGYPEMKNGYTLHELDTGKIYKFNEAGKTWLFWKNADGGGGGGGGDVDFATNAEAQAVLDSVFKNRHKGG